MFFCQYIRLFLGCQMTFKNQKLKTGIYWKKSSRQCGIYVLSYLTILWFVLDEKLQRNASQFAIFFEYENHNSFFFRFSFRATLDLLQSMSTVTSPKQLEMKKKRVFRFSYSKNMANFEAFLWSFLSSTNSEIVKSVSLT